MRDVQEAKNMLLFHTGGWQNRLLLSQKLQMKLGHERAAPFFSSLKFKKLNINILENFEKNTMT
jgi:hypothetical protein